MKKKKLLAMAMAAVMAASSIVSPESTQAAGRSKIKLNKTKVTLTVKKKTTLCLKNYKGRKKVSWKVDRKKLLKLSPKGKNKVQITAKKAGNAKVTAKAGDKKYICRVVIKKASRPKKTTPAVVQNTVAPAAPASSAGIIPASDVTLTPEIRNTPAVSQLPPETDIPEETPGKTPVMEPTATTNPEPAATSAPEAAQEPTEPTIEPVPEVTPAGVDVTEKNLNQALVVGAQSTSEKVQGISVFSKSSLHLVEVFGNFQDIREVKDSITLELAGEGTAVLSEEYSAEAYFSDGTPGYYRIDVTGSLNGETLQQTYFMGRAGVFCYTDRQDGTCMIKDYEGWGAHLVVPELLDGKKVSACGTESFYHKKIGDLVLSDGIAELQNRSFYKAQMASVELPESIKIIGKEAFRSCETMSILSLPGHISHIGENAFYRTPWLAAQPVGTNGLCVVHNILLSADGVTGNLTIPEGITCIAAGIFAGNEALYGVTIPESVTEIPEKLFSNCTSLSAITIPAGVQQFGRQAFQKTPWLWQQQSASEDGIVVVNHVIVDGREAKGDIVIGDDIVKIAGGAFEAARIYHVSGMKNVTEIGERAFYCSDLWEITLPSGLTSIEAKAFAETNMEALDIPENVKSIGEGVFRGCTNMKSISLSDSLQEIGENAFYSCTLLREVMIPASVREISSNAFYRCDSLKKVTISGKTTALAQNAFARCYDDDLTFYIPADSAALEYMKANQYKYELLQ